MNKIPCASLLMFASLVTLDGFHLLLSTQLTANLSLEWWIHVSSIVTCSYKKLLFSGVETVGNNALNHWCVAIFDQLWANTVPTFNTAFSLTNVHAKMMNTLPSDIFNSSAISCNFNLQSVKMSLWSFLVFSRTTAELGRPKCSASFVSIQLHLKSAYHLLTIVSDGTESK